ncbi:MAG: NTP transferase domain-containing protein [Candidatus Baltobacteraceae bacterium]
MGFYASITAGGRVSGEFARAIGTEVKALARVGSRTMLDRAIDAARNTGALGIAVIGGDEVRAACGSRVEKVIPESNRGAANLHSALFAWKDERLLLLSSDLPFISSDALGAFIDRVPADTLGMPVAGADTYREMFPDSSPHITDIGAERVANGSAFLFPAHGAIAVDNLAQSFFEARKNLLRMALLIGPRLLVKFALHSLRIADLEQLASRRLGFPVAAIRDCAPELCYDVDDVSEYRYACARS